MLVGGDQQGISMPVTDIVCDSCGKHDSASYGYPDEGVLCEECWKKDEINYLNSRISSLEWQKKSIDLKIKELEMEKDKLK